VLHRIAQNSLIFPLIFVTDGVAWSVYVSVCVCRFVTFVSPKNGWTDRDAVWRLTDVGPRNMYSMGMKIGQIHSQPGGVTRRRCGLSSKFCDHLSLFLGCERHIPRVHVRYLCIRPQDQNSSQIYATAYAYVT